MALAQASTAGWQVERIGRVGRTYYEDVAVVTNARGRRAVAWTNRRKLHVAVATAGHGFGRPRLVTREKRELDAPRLAMNGRGDTLIVWSYFDGTYRAGEFDREEDCCYGVRLAVLSRDGQLGGVRTLTPRGHDVSLGDWAIDPDGRVGVVWNENQYYFSGQPGLFARFSGPRGLRRARKIDRDGQAVGLSWVQSRPRVLIAAVGRKHRRLVERYGRVGGRFGRRRLVARHLPGYLIIATATNERGDQAIAWWADRFDRRPVHAGTRSPGGRLKARTIARTNPSDHPTVAIAPSGAAAVAWASSYKQVMVATAGGWGAPFRDAKLVLPPRETKFVDRVELGVNSREQVVVAWASAQRAGTVTIHAAVRTASGHTTRHARLARGLERIDLGNAAIDESGRATVVWRRSRDIRAGRIKVAR